MLLSLILESHKNVVSCWCTKLAQLTDVFDHIQSQL